MGSKVSDLFVVALGKQILKLWKAEIKTGSFLKPIVF